MDRIKLLLVFSIFGNLILGYFLGSHIIWPRDITSTQQSSPRNELFPLLGGNNSELDSNSTDGDEIIHYADLRPVLVEDIEDFEASSNLGLFLQDVSSGSWMGINERDGFTPASLLKIPIMMAILKKVDREEIDLKDKISLAEEDIDTNAGELYLQGAGFETTYGDLIRIMILSSDNTAKNALKRQLTEAELNAVFAHVGIPNPYLASTDQVVTPRDFSRLFKSLYLSTFLSPNMSQRALDLATDTTVESLISSGVNPEVQVAHKYGERPDGLADCGIVYHPHNPYYICIMTKDIEITKAKSLIAKLSSDIYQFVDSKDLPTQP